jgi:hypothetical protein
MERLFLPDRLTANIGYTEHANWALLDDTALIRKKWSGAWRRHLTAGTIGDIIGGLHVGSGLLVANITVSWDPGAGGHEGHDESKRAMEE